MKKINLYVFIQIIKSCTLIFFIFVSIAWLMQISRLFSIMNTFQVDFISILFLSFYLIPNLINILLPFIIIFGLILAFIKFDKDKEIIAMFSLGLSINEIKKPLTTVGFLFIIFYIILNFFISPYIYQKYKEKEFQLRSAVNINDITLSNFLKIDNIILDFKKTNKKFEDIFINFNNKDNIENIIFANKGEIKKENEKIIFNLIDGFKLSILENSNEKLEFENYKLEFETGSNKINYQIFDRNSQTIFELIKNKNIGMIVERFFDFLVVFIIIILFYRYNINNNLFKMREIFIFLMLSIFLCIGQNIIKNIELKIIMSLMLNTLNILSVIIFLIYNKINNYE